MSLVVTDLGEVEMLKWTLLPDGTRPANLLVMLFRNDVQIYRNSVIGDFVEASFAGYSRFPLAWADWSLPATFDGAAVSIYTGGPVTFVPSVGTQTVYGFLILPASGSPAIWGDRFDFPKILNPTSPLTFAPYMRAHSEVEPAPPP